MRASIAMGCVAGLMLLLGGCSGSASSDTTPASAPTADSPDDTSVRPPAPDASASGRSDDGNDAPVAETGDLDVDITRDTYEFQFSYPAQAAAIPELKIWFDARRKDARTRIETMAANGKNDAQSGNYPFNPYAFTANWQVVTDLPDWLSLSAETYMFTGGAHGMSGFNALVWDRKTKARLAATDFFTSPDALSAALRKRFCKALDEERIKRRGGPLTPGDTFSDCIDPVAQTVLLGSSDGKTFNRIGFQIGPYEAGPYSEGSYEITLPVDAAVMRALKPQYRNSFSIPG